MSNNSDEGDMDSVSVSLDDYAQATDNEPLPNSEAYMGGETDAPERPNLDERKEEFKSRLKSGWSPPNEKISALPARGAGVPTIDEWLDFFSRVIVGMATDFLIEMAFRGIDEDLLSDREIQTIKLDQQERERIARPFAEFAHRNKFTRKHGREIIAFAGSFDAIMQLGLWYTRMTRIAMKYRRMQGKAEPRWQRRSRGRAPQPQRAEQKVIHVQPQDMEVNNVSSGQGTPDAAANGHNREWRPDVGGPVYNPGG